MTNGIPCDECDKPSIAEISDLGSTQGGIEGSFQPSVRAPRHHVSGGDETADRPHSHTRRMDTAAERHPAPRYPAGY